MLDSMQVYLLAVERQPARPLSPRYSPPWRSTPAYAERGSLRSYCTAPHGASTDILGDDTTTRCKNPGWGETEPGAEPHCAPVKLRIRAWSPLAAGGER